LTFISAPTGRRWSRWTQFIELVAKPEARGLIGPSCMVQLVLDQLKHVLDSYACRDVTEALEDWRKDEEVDALNNSLFRELLTYVMGD